MMLHTALVDPFDGPEIATLAASFLSLVGLIVVAVISNRGRQHSQVVRAQVENEHQQSANPNLREDIDAKHVENAKKLDAIGRDMHAVKLDINILRTGWQTNRNDIDDLMDTETRRRRDSIWAEPRSRRERRNQP